MIKRHETVAVRVGGVQIGGGAPVVVQSMTNTDTANAGATARQVCELAEAGSELVRFTVNTEAAAVAVPEIAARVRDAGHGVPLVGDFHYNGHLLLRENAKCAELLAKYRINPGNVGAGSNRDANFTEICQIAAQNGKPVRIGVNAGSLNQELVEEQRRRNTEDGLGKSAEQVLNDCMIISALQSTELAMEAGSREDQIVISCKCSTPVHLIEVYRELANRTRQPLHLGLTEASMGVKGLVWSAASMAVLLEEGIGDTIRVSLTPRPGGDRREEVYASWELLQALGLRAFAPSLTSCPGCGRTSPLFQKLAGAMEEYLRRRAPEWRKAREGVENLKVAVMGCIVNGPGESKAANIGISLPGADEEPACQVHENGARVATLTGSSEEILEAFQRLLEEYVAKTYALMRKK